MNRLPVVANRATTAQLACVYPFQVAAPLAADGVPIGTDVTAGGAPFLFDPFDAYRAGLVTNPNMVVFGEPGCGKSALVKCLAARAIRTSGRWVAVADPKGEYAPLADALGLERIAIAPGGTVRLNPLARHPDELATAAVARQLATMTGLLSLTLRRELDAFEETAVAVGLEAVHRDHRDATLQDLAGLLVEPPEPLVHLAACDHAEVSARLLELRFGLDRLLRGRLAGMFDGPSTITLDAGGAGVVIDLSAIHADREALAAVLIATTGWLHSVLAGAARPCIQILDEAWALLGLERAVRYLQSCLKLGRSLGVANIVVAHRISDLRAQADDGTATAKLGEGLLADCATRVMFRQSTDQIADARTALGLTDPEADIVGRIVRGRALWHVGPHRRVVAHHIAADEIALCDTDRRMLA